MADRSITPLSISGFYISAPETILHMKKGSPFEQFPQPAVCWIKEKLGFVSDFN